MQAPQLKIVLRIAALLSVLAIVIAISALGRTLGFGREKSVQLAPVGSSYITGRVGYRAAKNGTEVKLSLKGAASSTTIRVLLRAGTCAKHGAIFAVVVSGRLLFHGRPVSIDTVADGSHVFTVVRNGREVACAAIPAAD